MMLQETFKELVIWGLLSSYENDALRSQNFEKIHVSLHHSLAGFDGYSL